MNYWLKLYVEILDDPKVGLMSDLLFKRFIQFLLVAKERNQGGLLGPVNELAWRLRTTESEILDILTTMSKSTGIVSETPAGWVVVNFQKRQCQYSESYERVKRYRERNSNDKKNVTVAGVSSSSSSDSDSLEEGVQGGKPTIPTTPREAYDHPVIGVFQKVTERIPGVSQYGLVIDSIRHICNTKKLTDEAAIDYLKPFWLAWTSRKKKGGQPYDPANLAWLTEWAVNGEIPKNGHKPSTIEEFRTLQEGAA